MPPDTLLSLPKSQVKRQEVISGECSPRVLTALSGECSPGVLTALSAAWGSIQEL